jgi:hypothetical protein
MRLPLERGLGGFVKMYDEAHRGLRNKTFDTPRRIEGFNQNANVI